jgi:hypothetical protein
MKNKASKNTTSTSKHREPIPSGLRPKIVPNEKVPLCLKPDPDQVNITAEMLLADLKRDGCDVSTEELEKVGKELTGDIFEGFRYVYAWLFLKRWEGEGGLISCEHGGKQCWYVTPPDAGEDN